MKTLLALAIILASLAPHNTYAQEQILPGDLIKGSGPAVYYFYGNRYAFPNEAVYFTWYSDFSKVKTVTDEFLASIPLVANMRFKPGSVMIKITSDPKVYALENGNTLRWIETEETAKTMYGEEWAKEVRDVLDSLFIDYQIGESIDIESSSEFWRGTTLSKYPEAIDALKETIAPAAQPYDNFPHPASTASSIETTAYGFSASYEDEYEDVVQFYSSLGGAGFMLAYQNTANFAILGLASTSTQLNFVSTTSPKRHRSVQIGTLVFFPFPLVDYYDMTFPSWYPPYERGVTTEYAQGKRLLNHEIHTKDDISAARSWYIENATQAGFELVTEKEDLDFQKHGTTKRTIFFRKPNTTADWLTVTLFKNGDIKLIDFPGTAIEVVGSGL